MECSDLSSLPKTGAAQAALVRRQRTAGFGPDARLHPNRAPFEYYPTPPEATRALLSVEAFDGSIWEPACGDGAISREMTAAGYSVVSTDVTDHGFGVPGIDFLAQTAPRAKHIVTNPPYGRGLADRFIGKALTLTRETGGSVAMLLNLASLCHPSRHRKFVHSPPAAIYALDELVCYPNGNPAEATIHTRTHRYYWAIWKPGHVGRPSFWWLSTGSFRSKPSSDDCAETSPAVPVRLRGRQALA